MKHTPAPWKVDDFCGTIIWADNAYEDAPFHVADIRGWGTLQKLFKEDEAIEIQNANARLIAAAPEMYDIITNLLIGIEFVEDLNPNILIRVNSDFVKSAKELLSRIDSGEI